MFKFLKGLWKSVTSIFSKREATVDKREATIEQKQEALQFFMENPDIGLSHEEILNFFTNQKVKDAALAFFDCYKLSGKITFAQTVKAFCNEEIIKRFVTDAAKEPQAQLWLASLHHFVEHSASSNLTWRETVNALIGADRSFDSGLLPFEKAVKIFETTAVTHKVTSNDTSNIPSKYHQAILGHLAKKLPDRGPPPLPPRLEPLPPLPTCEPPPPPRLRGKARSETPSVTVDRRPLPPLPPRPQEHEAARQPASVTQGKLHVAAPPLPLPPSTPYPETGNAKPPSGKPLARRLAPPPNPAPRNPVGFKTLQQASSERSISP